MTKSIASFSFDKAKAGRILKQYIEESPYSQRQIAPMVGMSEDMLSNVLRGMNKEISLERIFKICIVTGRPVCEFIREMLDGEDIDFRAEFEAICPPSSANLAEPAANFADASAPRGIAVRKVAVAVQETEEILQEPPLFKSLGPDVLAFLRADRAEQAQRTSDIYHEHSNIMLAQYKDQILQLKESRQITISHYDERIAIMREEHEKRISEIKVGHAEVVAEMEKRYAKNIEFLKSELKKARRLATTFGILFTAETLGIIILFFVDALNHHVGWLRGFFPFLSDGVSESLRS